MLTDTVAFDPYKAAVLNALSRNRSPGYSFTGYLVNVLYEFAKTEHSSLICQSAPHVLSDSGNVDFGAVAVLADIALGACPRVAGGGSMRMATVSMSMLMHGQTSTDSLHAEARLGSFDECSGLTSTIAHLRSGEIPLCTVTGILLALPAPAGIPDVKPDAAQLPSESIDLDESRLSSDEMEIYARLAQREAATGNSFLERFWGFEIQAADAGATGQLLVGPHIGNRVGHVQGGVLFSFAAAVSRATASPGFRLASMHATFHRPGIGGTLRATTFQAHRGRTTEVVSTSITDRLGSWVMLAQSTFCRG